MSSWQPQRREDRCYIPSLNLAPFEKTTCGAGVRDAPLCILLGITQCCVTISDNLGKSMKFPCIPRSGFVHKWQRHALQGKSHCRGINVPLTGKYRVTIHDDHRAVVSHRTGWHVLVTSGQGYITAIVLGGGIRQRQRCRLSIVRVDHFKAPHCSQWLHIVVHANLKRKPYVVLEPGCSSCSVCKY
jgi:hypothetical protein